MSDTYKIPNLKNGAVHRVELIVKKSRFITTVARTHGVDEAKAFISKVTEEFSDARHNCFAYVADKPGNSGYAGCSDDGEPHGTAGQPMLNILLHSDVGEITCVVTRYFGGILLGTGGLVKAYSDSIKLALESLDVTDMVIMNRATIRVDHSIVNLVLRLFKKYQCEIINQEYTDKVSYTVDIPADSFDNLQSEITTISRGEAFITKENRVCN